MASEMREALVAVKELFDGGIMFQNAIRKVHRQVNDALSSPRLNCEVGTVEEQVKRFKERCRTQSCHRVVCGNDAKVFYLAECAIRWSQMPYESEVE